MILIEAARRAPLNEKFWRWFGRSTVVGHGGPLVVFHGSNAHAYVGGQVDVFHTRPASGRGAAFFTSSAELAHEYGEKVYGVYLRIENPLVVFGDGKHWSELGHATKIDGHVTDQLRAYHKRQASETDEILRRLSMLDTDQDDTSPTPSRISDDTDALGTFDLSILPQMEASASTDEIIRQARRMGYDGVTFKNIIDSPTGDRHLYKGLPADVYAVFSPFQIKSIENDGHWDIDDPAIMH